MNPTLRPSVILALVISAVAVTGCPYPSCGDMSYENRESVGSYDLNEDGMAVSWDDTLVDPSTTEGCETLCVGITWGGDVTEIHSCEAVIDEGGGDTGTSDTGDSGPQVDITCVTSGMDPCIGGRHTGLLAGRAHGQGGDAVGAWLAREACGEAGSVLAFRQLARELRHHGAPEALIEAARAAAADEVRHTRMVRRLAEKRGGTPAPVTAQRTPARTLLALAVENAVEGCVHETFAAARAGWQALHAEDPDVRAASRVLAEDEARHADLAAAVHAWACAVLPAEQAAVVEAARVGAWTRLADDAPVVPERASTVLGLPDAATHRVLARALAGELHARAA